jgi:small subunit ribosomal protein S11
MVRYLLLAGVNVCDVVLSGTGRGRNVIVKAVLASGRSIGSISEGTKEPHNGCRPKKARRV